MSDIGAINNPPVGGGTGGAAFTLNNSTDSVTISGGNNITVSNNASTILISAPNQSVQTQGSVLINGSSGSIVLTAGANISLSQNASTITISASNQSVQTQNLVDVTLAGNTSGALALISSGTMTLAGGNNITLSQAGNAVTISGGGAQAATNSMIWLGTQLNSNGLTATSLLIWPQPFTGYFSATRANVFFSVSLSTSATNGSTNSAQVGISMVLYSNNNSTLSSMSSGGATFGWTFSSNNSTASLNGVRMMSFPFSCNITPGDYWCGFNWTSTTGANLGATFNLIVGSNLYIGANTFSGSLGAASNATSQPSLGWGAVNTSGTLASLPFTSISGDTPIHRNVPYIALANFTA